MRTKTKGKGLAEKTNITLKLDRDLLREIKILAAKRDTSISALLSAQLEKLVNEYEDSDAIRTRAVERMRRGYELGFTPAKSRDELHER